MLTGQLQTKFLNVAKSNMCSWHMLSEKPVGLSYCMRAILLSMSSQKKLTIILNLQLSKKSRLSLNEIDSVGENFLVNNCGMYSWFVLKILLRMRFLSHFQNQYIVVLLTLLMADRKCVNDVQSRGSFQPRFRLRVPWDKYILITNPLCNLHRFAWQATLSRKCQAIKALSNYDLSNQLPSYFVLLFLIISFITLELYHRPCCS